MFVAVTSSGLPVLLSLSLVQRSRSVTCASSSTKHLTKGQAYLA